MTHGFPQRRPPTGRLHFPCSTDPRMPSLATRSDTSRARETYLQKVISVDARGGFQATLFPPWVLVSGYSVECRLPSGDGVCRCLTDGVCRCLTDSGHTRCSLVSYLPVPLCSNPVSRGFDSVSPGRRLECNCFFFQQAVVGDACPPSHVIEHHGHPGRCSYPGATRCNATGDPGGTSRSGTQRPSSYVHKARLWRGWRPVLAHCRLFHALDLGGCCFVDISGRASCKRDPRWKRRVCAKCSPPCEQRLLAESRCLPQDAALLGSAAKSIPGRAGTRGTFLGGHRSQSSDVMCPVPVGSGTSMPTCAGFGRTASHG